MGASARTGSRRSKSLLRTGLRRITTDQMGSALIFALVGLCALLVYVGMYAKATKNGYCRSQLATELREARVENQRLRADIQALSSPDRLSQIAKAAGMQQCGEFDYVRSGAPLVVADASRN